MGRNFRGSEAKKSKRFSLGDLRKLAIRRQSRAAGECLGHFQVLAVDPGNSWPPSGLEEGYAMVCSADFGALAETLWM